MLRIAGVLLFLLAACAPAALAPSPSPLSEAAARRLILEQELTDVRTGGRFTLGGARGVGGVTVVVNAAMW